MKADFNRAALAEALTLLSTVVPNRTPKPILKCVKIEADKDVHISATDLEVGINFTFSQVKVRSGGAIVVPCDKLTSIVRESTDETLSIVSDKGICEVTGSDSHFTIYGQEPDQYPAVPSFDGKADIEVELATLQEGIEQTLFATAKESTRYALNGVLWEAKGKKLSLVATDGRRLAKTRFSLSVKASEKAEQSKIIVPSKTMSLLDKIGDSEKQTLSIKFEDNKIMINCSNAVITSTLVEGNFPKYEDIIPTDYDKKVKLSTESATSAVRRAALLTSEESRGIKLSLNKQKLVFSARAPESGDATVEMPIEYSAEPIEIGFNPQFLTDMLRVIRADEFDLELGQPDRPGLIKAGQNFLYVIMPINLG